MKENYDGVDLGRDHLVELARQMILIRRFEEKCAELYSAEKIRGFLHLYIGEEANAVGVMQALAPDDAIVATYREHGHALARGIPARPVMAEMYGKVSGTCRGRGGSMHICDADTRFYGGFAIVGGGLPLAVGLALADRMQGRNRVTCCFFGEGAAAEGEFHEALNLAALWRLPVLFVCENNGYAMGTALKRSESQISIARHAESYDVPAVQVDGMDVLAVEEAARAAVAKIRSEPGPQFIESMTYRFRAHSMFDAELYRDKAEVEAWRSKGPLVVFKAWVEERNHLAASDFDRLETEADAVIADAVAFAEAAEWENIADLTRDVMTPTAPATEVA
jgi:pyruvate dehydrogenase E1 component alpha subunit